MGIRTTSPELLPKIVALLPPGSKRLRVKRVEILYSLLAPGEARPGLKRFNILYAGAGRVARSLDLGEVLNALRDGLLATVAFNAKDRTFLKGGVVELDGRAIVIAAPPGAGTTRLIEAFIRSGARYYSDQYAVVDGSGNVHPLQPATRRRSGAPIKAGGIVVTNYREGARFKPRMLSPGEAMLELLAITAPLRLRPRTAIARLRRLVDRAPVFKGVRGDADETAASIMEKLKVMGAR